jgi:hypothetical protein
MSFRAGLALALWCMLAPSSTPAAEPIPIAVMEFSSKGGVTQKQMDALGDMLANEIRAMGNYRVIGKSDIHTALDLEQRKTMMGCNEDSCIAEIGGALGVRWVVVGNISLFGETYLLNLKMLDAEKVQVVSGVSKKVGGGEEKLIDALSSGSKELFEKAGPTILGRKPEPDKDDPVATETGDKPDKIPPPPPPVVVEKAPSWLNTWGHATFWSGTGLVVLGTVSLIVGLKRGDEYGETDREFSSRISALNDSRNWATTMWVGYGMGFALMATGAAFWIWEAVADSPDSNASVAPTLDGNGVVFSVGGRW